MATIVFSPSTDPHNSIPEDADENTVIGTFSVNGGGTGEVFSFTQDNPNFEIIDKDNDGIYELRVKDDVSFDFDDGQRQFDLTVQATSTNGTTAVGNLPVRIDVTNVNERPDIALDDREVHEGALPGTVVYTLIAHDPDGDVVTYELSEESEAVFDLVDNRDGSWSVVVDDAVKWLELGNDAHDHFTVKIKHGADTYEDTFDLNLSENLEPEISFQAETISQAAQGGTVVGILTALDPDGHQITYTLSDESKELFELARNSNGTWSVRVKAGVTLDYENEDHKSFSVIGNDHFNDVEGTFFLTFVNKEPALSFTSVTVNEGAQGDTVVGKLLAIDPENDEVTYKLSAESAKLFDLLENDQGGYDIIVRDGVVLDYENPEHRRKIGITISDGTHTVSKEFQIDLIDQVDLVMGTSKKDNLKGGTGSDIVKGLAGNDHLVGGSGDDWLYGGSGKDTLIGDAGKDVFVFDTKPNKKTNLDRVGEYNVKDDTIWLDNKIFTKFGKTGSVTKPAALKKAFFKIGDKAKDKDDYLIYNKKTGMLSYDADGSGSKAAVEIALLKKGLAMTYKEFFVI